MRLGGRRLAGMVVAVIMAGAVTNAAADTVSIWDYDVLTGFNGNNTFTSGGGTQIQNQTQVSWGATGGNVFTGDTGNSSTNRSGITIATTGAGNNDAPPPADVTGQVTTGATSIPGIGLGSWITHHNNPISGSFATLLTSQIDQTLTLVPNTPPIVGQQGPSTLTFTIFFAETPNSTPCTAPSPSGNPCNDIFALNPAQAFNQEFVFDGVDYFVSTFPVSGSGLTTFQPLTNAECAAAGANTGCVGFTTVEGQDTTIRFGFSITGEPITVPTGDVPQPATLMLAGLGLAAIGLVRNRKLILATRHRLS
jgi:hypothetical protein